MARPRKPEGEKKVILSVVVHPKVLALLERKYGNLSKALDELATTIWADELFEMMVQENQSGLETVDVVSAHDCRE